MGGLAQAWSAFVDLFAGREPATGSRLTSPSDPPVMLVKAKVREVLRRGVPVNRLEPGPAIHVARVVFADGSIALIRSIPEGHLIDAAVACLRTRVLAVPADVDSGGDIVLRWRRGQVLVELVGPDQPD